MSKPPFAKATPVNPPRVNKNINPKANNLAGWVKSKWPPHLVPIQLNTFIPVGTAIILVAAVKYARVSTSKPTVYL